MITSDLGAVSTNISVLLPIYGHVFFYTFTIATLFLLLLTTKITPVGTSDWRLIAEIPFGRTMISLILMILSGIPPFVTFITKLTILVSITDVGWVLWFCFLAPLLLISFYLYLHHFRGLLASTPLINAYHRDSVGAQLTPIVSLTLVILLSALLTAPLWLIDVWLGLLQLI